MAEVPNVVVPDVEPLNVIVDVAAKVPETDVVESVAPPEFTNAPRTVNAPST